MHKYLNPWMDTSIHGKPWWKVHVWPHLAGGVAIAGLLLLPWWTIGTLFERMLAVVAFQAAWELSQVVTWARRVWLRRLAWLWEPIPAAGGWPKAAGIVRHTAYGLTWAIAAETLLRHPTYWATALVTLGLQVFVTRLEHENWTGIGVFPWKRALCWNTGLGVLGWALVQVLG